MSRKEKFQPRITRVRLNPEQAVLACSCYGWNLVYPGTTLNAVGAACTGPVKSSSFSLCGVASGAVS